MALFRTEDCPVCNQPTSALKKTGVKYNGKYICRDCYWKIINRGITVTEIKKQSLDYLRRLADVNQDSLEFTIDVEVANIAEDVSNINKPVKVETEKLTLTSPVKQRLGKSFIAFDVETTGIDPQADRIIELGAVRFVDGIPVDSFSTLVNPNKRIPASATAVNHITNDMIIDAPDERTAFAAFLKYLDRAVVGSEIMCAHNASFDFGFLENTLKRLGYSAQLKYIDTLSLSRKYIKGIPSYKLGTIADCLSIQNRAAHRAAGDAEVCGKILIAILDSHSENGSYKEYFSNETFDKGKEMSQEELETCAVIQNIIKNAGCDIKGLRFRKNSSGYIDISLLYTMLKFKIAKKGKYIIVDQKYRQQITLPVCDCTMTEGGRDNIRVMFSNPFDLKELNRFFVERYTDAAKSVNEYLKYGGSKKSIDDWMNSIRRIASDEEANLITLAAERDYQDLKSDSDKEKTITRSDVIVNAINNRCPLCDIKNLNDEDKGFRDGYAFWERGEEKRKNGELMEAIELFDMARYHGYCYPALYESYAITYQKLNDLDNVIVIMEEALSREPYGKNGKFLARRDKAIQQLYKKQDKERKKEEKNKKKTEQETKRHEPQTKATKGRVIMQLDDAGNIIKEYETLSQAIKETGINSKSIRDAAKGVQKHAGGYCWKYKDEGELAEITVEIE